MQPRHRANVLATLAGTFLVFIIGYLDYSTGEELRISLFYLVPIALGTWFANWQTGIALSVLSTFAIVESLSLGHAATNAVRYWNAFMDLGFFVTVTLILYALNKELAHQKTLARTDPLTGVSNMRAFYELAGKELERSERYKHPLTLAYLDIDNFKNINDTYGHQSGDLLLSLIGGELKKTIRVFDVAARLGGDEFVVLLPETGGDAARGVVNKLHGVLSDISKKNEWPATYSIGVVTFETPPGSVAEMVKKADALMYESKQKGKNTVTYEASKTML